MAEHALAQVANIFSASGFAFLGGYIPTFVWVYFWAHEDCHPEPRRLLVYAFLAGMAAIPMAVLLEFWWSDILSTALQLPDHDPTLLLWQFTGWAFIEEIMKFTLISWVIFWRRDFDEPVDAMIYMMVGALGFAALENMLYLIPSFQESLASGVALTGIRFAGASLLHTLSSGVVGFYLAHNFCRGRLHWVIGSAVGITLASLLHMVFNLLLLSSMGDSIAPVIVLLSLSGVFLIFAFDHVKLIHQTCAIHVKDSDL
ncbi:MAG: PrsW family glutamic-type intramembrane protease [Patescibacteria group bacterium]